MDHRPPPRRRLPAFGLGGLALLVAGCAEDPNAYPHPGDSGAWTQGSVARTVLLYVVLPVAFAGLVWALASLPGTLRRNRYRPQEGWDAEPVWFAGPADPLVAVEQASDADDGRGGAGGSW